MGSYSNLFERSNFIGSCACAIWVQITDDVTQQENNFFRTVQGTFNTDIEHVYKFSACIK